MDKLSIKNSSTMIYNIIKDIIKQVLYGKKSKEKEIK